MHPSINQLLLFLCILLLFYFIYLLIYFVKRFEPAVDDEIKTLGSTVQNFLKNILEKHLTTVTFQSLLVGGLYVT